jgi:dihydrodipicolinate synthase/N-acetylneuraminate lyase
MAGNPRFPPALGFGSNGVVVMLKCAFGGLMLLVATAGDAGAGDQQRGFHRMSCTVVRFYVAKYSVGAAESYARGRGATDADIESARRCLSPGPVQTASFAK